MLSDDEARAARRARVLDAVTRGAGAGRSCPRPPRRRAAWRPGGWLAAACVAGLSVFLAIKLYQPTQFQPQTTPAAPAASTPRGPGPDADASAPEGPGLEGPRDRRLARAAGARRVASRGPGAPGSRRRTRRSSRRRRRLPRTLQSRRHLPPLPSSRRPPGHFRRPPLLRHRSSPERIESAPAAKASDSSAGSDEAVADVRGGLSVPASRRATFAEAPVAGRESRSDSSAELPPEPAARLRAAAAAGRTAEVEALLGQGAPVDAPDAAGDTALMKSLQADQPAAAAALRRHGASLDHKDHAGKSARDIVTTKGDPELNRAIGVGP